LVTIGSAAGGWLFLIMKHPSYIAKLQQVIIQLRLGFYQIVTFDKNA